MNIITALFQLENILAVVDILLILKLFFSLHMIIGWKVTGIFLLVYYLMDVFMIWCWGENAFTEWVHFGMTCVTLAGITLYNSCSNGWKNLLLTIPATLVYVEFDVCVELLMEVAELTKIYEKVGEEAGRVLLYGTEDIILLAILCYLAYKGKKKEQHMQLTMGEGIFLTVFCLFSPIITETLKYLEQKIEVNGFSVCWVVFVLAVNGAVIYGIFFRKCAKYYQQLAEQQQRQFGETYNYFQEYKNVNEETARFRHDWKNHMLVLQSMFQSGEYEAAVSYFSKLSERKEVGSRKVITGNEMVDIVLAAKEDVLQREGILVECQGNLSILGNMDSVDVCVLFSNLIDNAVESCIQCEGNRYLRIIVTENPNYFMICMENFMAEECKEKSTLYVTTKEDKGNHGLGLGNVWKVIEKYHGRIELEGKNYCFTVSMVFPKESMGVH
ncbi:MAG: GHKL domain-containing protein [Lachnospiraceae bacterium]|nr:GHKL domain-containing protein [Lachnospiraceae bacterium]